MSKVASDRLGGRKTLKVSGFLDEFEKDEIKDKVDIISLFASFGVELTKKGSSYIGLCPFHDDHNPSLSVDQGKGLFNCFGCGASGDVFDVVERIKGTDFKGSLKYLKEWIPGNEIKKQKSTGEKKNGHEAKIPSTPSPTFSTGQPAVSLEDVARHYEARLAQNHEAMDYLKKRGLHDTRIWNRFSIGFCDGSLVEKLSADQVTTLKTSGIINQKGREHFAGCITVPLYDEEKRIVGFYGRRINNRKPEHLYLPGGHKGLMNRESATVYRDGIIFTESIIDALSLLQTGIENVIPCYGVNGFTEEHETLLKERRVEEVIIAFDADEAGRNATEKLSSKLVDDGLKVKVIDPAMTSTLKDLSCKDWNDALLSGITKDEIKKLIEEAPINQQEKQEKLFTVEKDGPKYQFLFADLTYRILGAKETFVSSLRVNVRVERTEDAKKYLDNVDLYSARSRGAFALSASVHFSLETSRIERDLLLIVDHLEEERDKALSLEPEGEYVISPQEEAAGMDLLQSPDLIDRIIADTETLGYVGEDTNKLLLYIAASTRKLADPLSVIVISESAAGKSYLIDTVKKLMPPEDVVSMTSLSDQALNYLPENGLLHKFLVMGEAVHGDVVEHQVREMLSAHELSRLVTMKDPKTGELSSRTVRKDVIVSVAMSSTDYEINPENASRCFVINTDESEEQTKAIHHIQKKKYSLNRYEEREEDIPGIIMQHQAAQRLLKPRVIVNPLTERIRFPSTLMRTRRDHERFLDLIAGVCFLRQYQKEEKAHGRFSYIECDETDFSIAAGVMKEILSSTLHNFPRSAVLLYDKLRDVIRKKANEEKLLSTEVSVTQREIREATGFNLSFVRRNVRILVEYEYVKELGSNQRGSRRSYKLYADETISPQEIELVEDGQ